MLQTKLRILAAAFAALAASPAAAHEPGCAPTACPVDVAQAHLRITSTAAAEMADAARDMVDRGYAPGVVMLVEQDGKIVGDLVYGYADLETKRPMQRDSLSRIYSMTKTVTSLAALQLVARAKLALDDPVSKYIPELADVQVWNATDGEAPGPLARPLRIHDLLTHTAGFGYADARHPVLAQYEQRGIPAGPGVGGVPKDGSTPVASSVFPQCAAFGAGRRRPSSGSTPQIAFPACS
jgi:CubicO group peptidase (beta-lactamase class C family)